LGGTDLRIRAQVADEHDLVEGTAHGELHLVLKGSAAVRSRRRGAGPKRRRMVRKGKGRGHGGTGPGSGGAPSPRRRTFHAPPGPIPDVHDVPGGRP
jgi:hypothetical protein